ncbi:MAG: MBL fold metallo-hydrolase RNA specificity domain-containing protein [Nitrososphaerales archaeon]
MKETSTALLRTDHSKGISISKKEGIIVKTPSYSIALDPKRASNCDYAFVSHAHIDHVHSPNGRSKIISSNETSVLAKARGYDLGNTSEETRGMTLLDAGHILGSRSILIEDSVLYTGDFSRRDRGFLRGLKGVKCETLIMESTYGKQQYRFRETEDLVRQVSKVIADCFHQCRPVILTGYPLGKAQLLSYLFKDWDPVYLHESVYKMNAAHIDLGINLRDFKPYYLKSSSNLLERPPWILIAPSSSGRSNFIKSLREKYRAVTIGFTGWSLDPRYRYMMGLDYAFDVSDHSDFQELVSFAKECNPSRIFTVHGFAPEFAAHLRSLGFEAEALDEGDGQSTLSRYA